VKPKHKGFAGSLYTIQGRFYWDVRPPGQAKRKIIRLVPEGARYATKDHAAAVQIAQKLWKQWLLDAGLLPADQISPTITSLVAKHLEWAKDYYRVNPRQVDNIRLALGNLTDTYANLPAEDFSPLKLQEVRNTMIQANLARKHINQRINVIKRLFKWGAAQELVPPGVYHGLQAVEGLRYGRSGAREPEPVKPVAECHIEAIRPFAGPVVGAMLKLQLLTGMRSGELCRMRPCDIDTTGKIWFYRPFAHKTMHHGHSRIIAIGPKGQKILTPFLQRKLSACCFSPAEADKLRRAKRTEERTTPANCGNRPGTNRKEAPQVTPGESYDTKTYHRAVDYAIQAARKAGKTVPDFHPHQIRHTAATRIRKEFGLDAARAVLGQRTLAMADEYAELDAAKAAQAAEKLG